MGKHIYSLVPRPFWEGETAWQLPQVQTVTSAARELEDPIRFRSLSHDNSKLNSVMR